MFFRRHQVNMTNITIPVISIRDIDDLIIIWGHRQGKPCVIYYAEAFNYYLLHIKCGVEFVDIFLRQGIHTKRLKHEVEFSRFL